MRNNNDPYIDDNINYNNNVYINYDDLPENIKNKYNNEELLQRIGDAGEDAAYEYLIREYEKKGFIQDGKKENLNSVKLAKNNCDDFVEIKLCKINPRYDIEIIINENGGIITKYVEVKTHTINSILKGKIKLSYQQ
jgi:hypothetical protein